MHFVVVSFLFLSWLLVWELLSVTFSTPEGACEQGGCTNDGRPRRIRMIMLCLSEIVLDIGHATYARLPRKSISHLKWNFHQTTRCRQGCGPCHMTGDDVRVS